MSSQPVLTDYREQLGPAIKNGLKYLESLYDRKPWPFSCVSYSETREVFTEDYESKHKGYDEVFTHYLALLLIGEYFSPAIKERLIESTLPKDFGAARYWISYEALPCDTDTTSLAYCAFLKLNVVTGSDVKEIARKIFANKTPKGTVDLFFDPVIKYKNIYDAGAMVNVLILASLLKQEEEVRVTEDFVFNWLTSGQWKNGTLFYHTPLMFPYYVSALSKSSERAETRFKPYLLQAVQDFSPKFPLDFAFKKLILANLNLEESDDIPELDRALLNMQRDDGSWPADGAWGHWDKKYWGGEAISTIFAIAALITSVKESIAVE
ncbi:unnamed protein product [Allacma fusca]|uniref:Uncharacterized protein n=1 Tax=Allacma fusca TaxID=39272 RepID=A0A8J2PNQ9_9HEXA|nr:unnamed protein product [Allacma fusca]